MLHNAGLYVLQAGIEGTLSNAPFPVSWNGSLWTLPYEFMAYVAAGLVLSGWLRKHPATTSGVVLELVLILGVLVDGHVTTQLFLRGRYLGTFFLAGMLLFGVSRRVPASWPLLAAALGLVALVMATGVSAAWASLPLAYAVLWLGAAIPADWAPRTDVSYGVYIYAFPVQQTLALAGVQELGLVVFLALSVLCTVPLALARGSTSSTQLCSSRTGRAAPEAAAV